MNRIKALNEESSDDSDDGMDGSENPVQISREAQEENLHSLYSSSLKFIQDGQDELAKETLLLLLSNLKTVTNAQNVASVNQLHFLACKNLGLLCKDDIDYFLDALEIDSTDISLWIKTGQRAFDVFGDYQLARNCFEAARELSPRNWIIIDKLLESYFILHDLTSCFTLAMEALGMDKSFRKAKVLIYETCRLHPILLERLPKEQKCLTQLSDDTKETYTKIIDKLRLLKTKRKAKFEEDRLRAQPKAPKLSLSLVINDGTLKSIGSKILRLYEQMERDSIPVFAAIDVELDESASAFVGNQEEVAANTSPEGSNSAETANKDQEATDAAIKEKETSSGPTAVKKKALSRSTSGNGFPTEFLEKRRSGRVQKIQNKSRDGLDSNIYETLMRLMPLSMKERPAVEATQEEKVIEEKQKTIISAADAEKEIVSNFLSKQKTRKNNKTCCRVGDLIRDYLHEVARGAHHIKVPPVYSQLYKIHRNSHPLPFIPFVVIGEQLTLDEIWCMLVANELVYCKEEAMVLTQLTCKLEDALDEEKYTEFEVRVYVLRGTKDDKIYLDEVLKTLKEKQTQVESCNRTTISVSTVKSLIGSTCAASLTDLMESERYVELINLLLPRPESELSAAEEDLLVEAIVKSHSWERGVTLLSRRQHLNEKRLKLLLKCLETGKRAKLNGELVERLVKYATERASTTAWSCLYWALLGEGQPQEKERDRSVMQLITAGHQYLGKKGICTGNNGEFLLLAADYMLNHSSGSHRSMDEVIAHCFSCLFGYPARSKSSSSAHNVVPIKLKWEHAPLIYNYAIPEDLPEFDTLYRTNTIDGETEQLLLLILKLVPEDLRAESHVAPIDNYIEKGEPLDENTERESNSVTKDLYYLLADFNFKNKEFKKAKLYYKHDLCLNPDRFDSWAASALTRSSLLEEQLISGDSLSGQHAERFFHLVDATLRCFSSALKLEPSNTKLWIEYGNLAYNAASHASRLQKKAIYSNTRSKTELGFDVRRLKRKQKEMLDVSRKCFESANDSQTRHDEEGESDDEPEELWLPFYVLGKISERRRHILGALAYYEEADLHLYASGASYPKKIAYHSPPALAIEALEVHYRIHAAALKYLSNPTLEVTREKLLKINQYLVRAQRSTFVKREQFPYDEATIADQEPASSSRNASQSSQNPQTTAGGSSSNSQGNKIIDSISEVVGDLVSAVCDEANSALDANALRAKLIEMCLSAIKRCLIRFGAHYKSLYRLAYYHYKKQDVRTAKEVLMGSFVGWTSSTSPLSCESALSDPVTPELGSLASLGLGYGVSGVSGSNPLAMAMAASRAPVIAGLFAERKNANLFNGIWRIPIDDIDRPGSFSSHMYRSTFLLIRVCMAVFEYHMLCTMAIQLKRTPEVGKKYLRDGERVQLAREAFDACALVLKNQLLIPQMPQNLKEAILGEINKVADKLVKANVFAEEASSLIRDCYQYVKRGPGSGASSSGSKSGIK